jgi:hypothetical protein
VRSLARRLSAVAAAAALAVVLAPVALAATPTAPVYDQHGRLIQTPFTPAEGSVALLTKARAVQLFLAAPKVRHWLDRYPRKSLVTDATYDSTYRDWTVNVWSGPAGEIATGRIDDFTGAVKEAWTGPQVAWGMARGGNGAFGGKQINSPAVWLAFCVAFLLGLCDLRRPLSLRNLDLLVLLSFSVSLWYFNHGRIFTSVPLAYPPLLYLLGRMAWIGWRGRAPTSSPPVWPVWVLAAATVFLAGFRVGLNVQDSNVIDVGYAGVIGAQRIATGQSPYGHFPVEGSLKPCGPADRNGETRERIQTNGRCESANPTGDTYGPVSYEAYLPGYWLFGWTGKWDDLPAAHFTSIAFDLLCILGLALLGRRFGGNRLGVTLAFAWAAFPFTQYVSSSNTNDAIMPCLLIWGFWLVTRPIARGLFLGLASWTKFAALLLVPLWLSYPSWRRRDAVRVGVGFAVATLAAFSILLLEPSLTHAIRVFWDRTIPTQIDRHSPFSLWDWRQYHAGLPDLKWLQRLLEVALAAAALALGVWPRRRSPVQLAALSGALLIGFELVLTHWFYLYLPWFFGFVAMAVLAARPAEAEAWEAERDERRAGELVTAG